MLVLSLIAGLGLLVVGGDLLVRGAVRLALILGISPLVVGLTVVGFGTSTPELVTSLQAAAAGAPGIAVGNIVGSNIANILLILGLAALMMPFAVDRTAFRRDGLWLAIATLLALGVLLTGSLGRFGGAICLAALALYLWTALRSPPPDLETPEVDEETTNRAGLPRALLFAVGGLVLTIVGARLLVTSSVEIATTLGVSEAVIGLTLVAVGTSLPELVTSVMAAIRRQPEIAFGNVVGSNIFNALGILGVTALVTPIEVPAEMAGRDGWVMLAATAALIAVAVLAGRFGRLAGGGLVAAYAAYIWVLTAG